MVVVVQEKMSEAIERAIDAEHWPKARALIRSALKQHPNDHWLLTRLGSTYYEQHQYKRALIYIKNAMAISPKCPLVLWDYAGCLHMLDRHEEAISAFKQITTRGVDRIATGECGEGKAWARGVVADCHYCTAECYRKRGDTKRAARAYRRHLALRGPGCRSIYRIGDVREQQKSLGGGLHNQPHGR
jgi:tetratricopeptide (TPR) repeat protein